MLDAADALSFQEQLAWLANVLGSRGYPLPNLADDLETAAEVTRELVKSQHTTQLADTLLDGARLVRGLSSPAT